jgi:hypothetical protein
MNEKKLEYDILCFDTNNKCPFGDNEASLVYILRGNTKIFSDKAVFLNNSLTDNEKGIEIRIIKPCNLNNLDYSSVFFIKCFFDIQNKPDRLQIADSFRKNILEYLEKQGFGKIYITKDGISQYLLNNLYLKLNESENLVRSCIIKYLSLKEGVNSWFVKSIDNDVGLKIQKRKKNENNFSTDDHEGVDTRIYLVDFEDLGKIIYTNSLGNLNTEDLLNKITNSNSLEDLKLSVRKNIERYFSQFKEVSFQEKWEFLKTIRHKIAHNGLITLDEYKKAKESLIELCSFVQKIDDEAVQTSISEIEYQDFDKEEISSDIHSFTYDKIITKNEMIQELKAYKIWSDQVGREFLGLKNFLHNRLGGTKGFNIKKSWDMLEELQSEGYIVVSTWTDPGNIFPAQKEIKILRELPAYMI